MPIFEYACLNCGNPRFSRLVGVVAQSVAPTCPRCGSGDLQKMVSRFARGRAEDDVLESIANDADQINPDDPRAVRGLLHDMAGSLGEDLTGDDLEQIMDDTASSDGADSPE